MASRAVSSSEVSVINYAPSSDKITIRVSSLSDGRVSYVAQERNSVLSTSLVELLVISSRVVE